MSGIHTPRTQHTTTIGPQPNVGRQSTLRYTRETAEVTSGWLVKEGKAMKMHTPRYLVLSGSELSNLKAPGQQPTWTANIKDCAVGPGPRKFELVVNLPKRKVTFFAATSEDYDRWIIALKKASASNVNLDAFYKVGDVIGEGINGEVHIGWDRITNEPVAIKSIPYEGDFKAALDPEAEAEIEIVKSIDHPSLVKTYDIFRDGDKKRVYMVMEYVSGGELFARVANESGSLVKEGDAIRIARDLLSAVSYLHNLNIVHRDIKLENILCVSENVTKPIRIKLADFGLSSKLTGKEQSLQSLVGTSFYLAPEIITKMGYGPSVDAWAIGVVFYIVLSGQFPFAGDSDEMYYKNVVGQPLEFPDNEWRNVSQNAKDFIAGLLCKDPDKRLTVAEAMAHPWLTDNSIKPQPSLEVPASIGEQSSNLLTPKSFSFMKRKTPADILAKVESVQSAVDGRHK